MKVELKIGYEEIISYENLFAAWQEFVCGKKNKKDVQEFRVRLIDNILQLHEELANKTYRHGDYKSFHITDPKPRHIHKASVRDRVLHHAIYRKLYPFFDRAFLADSFSCRMGKGTHKALDHFRSMAYRVDQNNTKTCWVLKCDIEKFFANIDHQILLEILGKYISDQDIFWLLEEVIESFAMNPAKGLPLGNLTSQLFCNVYMNEFDKFVKHQLKVKYYLRYADDFVLLSENRDALLDKISRISNFLAHKLKLRLHSKKIILQTLASGVDFLGWVHFPHHWVLRQTTKRRMMAKLKNHPKPETLESYLGLLGHGDAFKTKQEVLNTYWLYQDTFRETDAEIRF